jgi:WD40 repeat protein/serine/threonine protein kinase
MTDSSSECNPIDKLAEEFVERQRRGEHPALTEYTRRYPQLAEEIRELFPALVVMEQLKPAAADHTGPYLAETTRHPERLGDFRILREVGRGGMGIVYEAEQESLGRHVALKVLPAAALLDAQRLQRFLREARAAARLHHTNVVPVFGVGEAEGLRFYVMQFISGLGLHEVLEELKRQRKAKDVRAPVPATPHAVSAAAVAQSLLTGRFRMTPALRAAGGSDESNDNPADRVAPQPPSTVIPCARADSSTLREEGRGYWQGVARIGLQAAEALAYARTQGVLHRDVKPSNLLLDTAGNVWITDFGLAKMVADSDNLTHTGDIVGTMRYMAPERFNGRGDARSDVYSLGLTLYELLTLRPAFAAADRTQLIHKVLHDEPARPLALNPKVPRDLETIVRKATERAPERRYATAQEMADDLHCFLEDRPIRARRVGQVERLWRWCQRNPAVAGLLATVAVLLVAITIGALIAAVWNGRLATDAEHAQGNEKVARQKAELTVTDLYTSQGLMAGDRDDPAQAVLWFANAARLAGPGTERESNNRARVATWSRQALQPVRALAHPAEWVSSLQFHPSGQYVLTQTHLVRQPEVLEEGDWTLWNLAAEAPLALPAGLGSASSAAWSPDGRWLALGTPQGEVLLCSFPSGEVLKRLPFAGRIHILAFSSDGRFLAIARANTVERTLLLENDWPRPGGSLSASHALAIALASPNGLSPSVPSTVFPLRTFPSYGVRVWDCQAGAFATQELKHPLPVAALAFHPQGHRLATGCWDQKARVFAIPNATGEPLFAPVDHLLGAHSLFGGQSGPPTFLDKGRGLLTKSGLAELAWRDAETGDFIRPVPLPIEYPMGGIWSVAVNRDGKYFALAGQSGAQIWEVATGRAVSPLLKTREMQVTVSAAFSPDWRMLLTGSSDHTLRRWSVPGGQALGRPIDHPTSVNLVVFFPDGRFLATAQRGGLVRIWAMPADNPRDYAVPLDGKNSLAKLSHEGRYVLATGQVESTMVRSTRVYEVATGRPAGPPLETDGILLDAALSPDGRQVATVVSPAQSWEERRSHEGQQAGKVKLWDWRTGKQVCDPLPMPSQPRCLDYSRDGQRLAVLCSGGQILVIDPNQGLNTLKWQADLGPFPFWGITNPGTVRFSPDGQSLVTYDIDSKVRVWEVATGRERYAALEHGRRCFDAQFSPDGRLLATAAQDDTCRIWDFATGRPLAEPLEHPDWVMRVVFNPDGRQVLTACRDGMARLLDWRTGQPVCPPFQHEHEVKAVAFAPAGRWVLTGSDDGTMRVWESRTGKPVTPPRFTGRGSTALGLAITPDGQYVVAGGWTDALQVIHLGDLSARNELDADDLCTWAELVAGQRVQEGGGVTNLTDKEWLDRWRAFRQRHPDYGKRPEFAAESAGEVRRNGSNRKQHVVAGSPSLESATSWH